MAIYKFRSGDFEEKICTGGGLVALWFHRSLKKGPRTFNFRSNEPCPDNLGPLGKYDHPWGKKNETNKLLSIIFRLTKSTKFHIFAAISIKIPFFRVVVTIRPGRSMLTVLCHELFYCYILGLPVSGYLKSAVNKRLASFIAYIITSCSFNPTFGFIYLIVYDKISLD